MARRRRRGSRDRHETPGPSGFLVVDKPTGWTSHDVVDAARAWLGTRRVGHLGTLDPLATGVLPLALRDSTKLAQFVSDSRKVYVGTVRLGEETDTLDAEGEVLRRYEGAFPDRAAVEEALASFVGEIDQLPPMYSAVKRDGVPLHKLAREGVEVEREPKRVRIDSIDLLRYEPPDLEIEVHCSGGTYVRTLAADVGTRLGCGAHLAALCRTASGPFEMDQARTPDEFAELAEQGLIEEEVIHPVNALDLPVLRLEAEEVARVVHGGEVTSTRSPVPPGGRVAALEPGGALVAVLETKPGHRLKPLRVFPPDPRARLPQGPSSVRIPRA